MFKYQKLGKFTYHIISNKDEINPLLSKWLGREWKIDNKEFPDQIWTIKWLKLLPQLNFSLEIVQLSDIRLRKDLMNYKTKDYSFIEELMERLKEMEESILQGSSIGPLIINRNDMELMDGYTRYTILKKHAQDDVYVYVGSIKA
jgi:hypothetical protein